MTVRKLCVTRPLALRALVIAAALLAGTALAQADPREGFLTIQKQVEAVQPKLVKTVVNLQMAGATGSGVVISPDGLVLTAGHVISGRRNSRCAVSLPDGRTLQGTYLGSDRENDLGLIKIPEVEDLPFAPLGDSATLRRGQWILAMGHPLGERRGRPPVLRIGRVISLLRAEDDSEPLRVSSDAPLISGDSGGPMFDLNGRVIGINSMITSAGRRMASIHVPVNLAKSAVDSARKGVKPEDWSGQSKEFVDSMRAGLSALRDGKHNEAASMAKSAVAADNASAEARVLLARASAAGGKTDAAAAAIIEAIERGYGDADSLRADSRLAAVLRKPAVMKQMARLDAISELPGARKGDRAILAAASPDTAGRGMVRLRAGERDVAFGTIMSPNGDLLTKASELPNGPLTAILSDGRSVTAEKVAADAEWDLALLSVPASGLKTLEFSETVPVGHWTFTPDSSGGLAAIGMVGVAEMEVKGRGIAPKPTSRAYMGVQLRPVNAEDLEALKIRQGVGVLVEPDRPAARAGMQSGDIIYEVDGKPVGDPDTLMDVMVDKRPGDTVRLQVARGEEHIEVTVNLATRPADLPGRGGLPEMLSGEVSRVSGPFPRVLHHDAVLKPSQMGGPVTDSDGKLIGLNIARADRTSTYAIPAHNLKEIYARLKAGSR